MTFSRPAGGSPVASKTARHELDAAPEAACAAFPVLRRGGGDLETPGFESHPSDERLEALSDQALLERLLGGPDPAASGLAASALIHRFGDLGAVLAAPPSELLRSAACTQGSVFRLKLACEAGRRLAYSRARDRSVISSWSAVLDYVATRLRHELREQFRVLFLDRKNRLILDEALGRGTVDHAPVYPREVMRRALELGASAVILVHNHPSGDPTPSQADQEMTRRIVAAGETLDIQVHDHLIVGGQSVLSFRNLGLMGGRT